MLTQPYHRRPRPVPQDFLLFEFNRIDLAQVALPPYPKPDSAGALPDSRPDANRLFDGRAAAAVSASVGDPAGVRVFPRPGFVNDHPDPEALLQLKLYPSISSPLILILSSKCLAAMAHADYFLVPDLSSEAAVGTPPAAEFLRSKVSQAILAAVPGWCGTYGPDIGDQGQTAGMEGNYDFEQMFMLALIYNFYDFLLPEAQEKLIGELLGLGRVRRANESDTLTSGGPPNDWSRAGYASLVGNVKDIPETENHVLMIATARYLTNQLLYQRNHDPNYDNRRNGDPGNSRPSCMNQLLGLLRNYLRDDFAEYNAKNYQEETRHALLNLCSYAYDAEVRLGARVVLDFISAHIAVSSNDLRRMVPFRRRDEGINVQQLPVGGVPLSGHGGFMDVSLLDAHGADPMPAQFALLAGNTRAYRKPNNRVWPKESTPARPWSWAITPNFSSELTLGALSDYRLPPSIHDLFVNDLHRRFFQRIHRRPLEEPGQQRNCDNMEIYAGSPSYLITAGGEPAQFVIQGGPFGIGAQTQNSGVAVPTSFMPTGDSAVRLPDSLQHLCDLVGMSARPISLKAVAQVFGVSVPFSFKQLSAAAAPAVSRNPSPNDARDLIQLSYFSDTVAPFLGTKNYGVAPDFACGYACYLPAWTGVPAGDGVFFINRKSQGDELAGFFLAIIKQSSFVLIEAFDAWRHPEVSFEAFRDHVLKANQGIQLENHKETVYSTFFGNRIHFKIWDKPSSDDFTLRGSEILNIEYAAGDPLDTLVEAGNYTDQAQFLSGSILKSAGDPVVEIHNPSLKTKITLDWSDESHLVRISEDGEVEQAGKNAAGQLYEVWVDFDWDGPFEGDFYRPFNQLASAVAAVADGGVIKIAPGTTRVRGPILGGKRMKIVAPIGGVTIGAR